VTPEPLAEDLLSAYLDGECDTAERAAVEARLAHDADWRAILDDLRTVRATVRSLPWHAPPVGYVDRLPQLVRDADAAGSATARPRARRVALAGLSAAAAVAVGFVLASPSGRGDDVAPPVAALVDSHGVTATVQSDPITGLAPLAADAGAAP
jgi:anti-sigma factor RsiW